MIEATRFHLECRFCIHPVGTLPCSWCEKFISGDQMQYEIKRSVQNPYRGWYIIVSVNDPGKPKLFIHKDLELHRGTGWDDAKHSSMGDAPGYYCSERHAALTLYTFKKGHNMTDKIEISVKMNGKDVPLHEVSEQTLLGIREASKPKLVPVFQVCDWSRNDKRRRLILRITPEMLNDRLPYILLAESGDVVGSFHTMEDLDDSYYGRRELKLEEL